MSMRVQRLVTFNGEDFDLTHLDLHSDGAWTVYLRTCEVEHVDMLKMARAVRGRSRDNALDKVARDYLGVGKADSGDNVFSTMTSADWDRRTLEKMIHYNAMDVILTVRLYTETVLGEYFEWLVSSGIVRRDVKSANSTSVADASTTQILDICEHRGSSWDIGVNPILRK